MASSSSSSNNAAAAAASSIANDPLFSGLPPLPHVAGAEPQLIAQDIFKIAAAVRVSESLGAFDFHLFLSRKKKKKNLEADFRNGNDYEGIDLEKAYEGVESGKKGADLAVAVPRFRLKGDPKALAKKVVDEFVPDEYLSKAVVFGGFIQFSFNDTTLNRLVLNQVNALTHLHPSGKPSYGTNKSGAGKKIVLEYSSPNIAKVKF
jgi:arginyl-tRNA synthetase